MRVDLERDQAERLERIGLHDRHVVCRADRRAGHDRARARADVGPALRDAPPDRLQEREVLKRLEEPERVASADEEGWRVHGRAPRIGDFVKGLEGVSHLREAFPCPRGVGVPIEERVGYEKHPRHRPEEIADRRLGVIEVAASVQGRIADEQKASSRRHARTSRPGRIYQLTQ